MGYFVLHGMPGAGQTSAALLQAQGAVRAAPDETLHARVWLNPKNRKLMDDTVAGLYEEGSATYRHFLKPEDLAQFRPLAADVAAVKAELAAGGLAVSSAAANSLYVEVEGPVAKLEAAFHTQIMNEVVNGKARHATTQKPAMDAATAPLVAGITGLTGRTRKPNLVHPVDPDTGKASPMVSLASPAGVFFSSDCFRGVESRRFTTPGTKLPIAEYVGNRFGANVTNTAAGTLPPCGYDAQNFTTAYGMQAAYNKGLDGTGQTIVIVDAYGSPTIQADANTFSSLNGLPTLTAKNFKVVYPLGAPKPTTADNATGWAEETSLDVEWAHALAPGASITLVVAPSNSDSDLAVSLFYAIERGLGSVISNSYSGDEYDDLQYSPQELVVSNLISEIGALLGISVNFSSGDDGDLEAVVGTKTVSDLGASPYATSVGGTSLAVTGKNTRKFETGWGGNLTKLAGADGTPLVPALQEGFFGGAGGGESVFFRQPKWQSSLPGKGRQQPDISLDVDPYTGVEFIVTEGGVPLIGAIGGTSLSCPAFSAVWAIANQRAGQIYGKGTLLGQAAPTVARLAGSNAVTDVLPYTSPTDVVGLIFSDSGVTFYPASELAAPLEGTSEFYSALYNSPYSGSWFTLTFGTDTSLKVKPGWDNVTGFGTPNGLPFVEAAAR